MLGIHSPRTTPALTEVPIGSSKADFILINGKAVVYEIKTALDNFDRLDGQIEDYYKAFSRTVVVTSESFIFSVPIVRGVFLHSKLILWAFFIVMSLRR